MEFKGILKKRTTSAKIALLVVGAMLMVMEYKAKQYFYLPITAFILIAVFHKKDHIVSEEGVNIKRSIFGLVSDDIWSWDEITAIQPDYIKFRPNAQITFEKGSMLRSFLVTPEDCEKIIDLAEKMNPRMYVDNFTEEEQEQFEKEKLHRQEQLRAQRAKKKRSKKK